MLITVITVRRGRVSLAGAVLILCAAFICGSAGGHQRLASIDDGAMEVPVAGPVSIAGFTTGAARTSRGVTRIPFETAAGRTIIETTNPPGNLSIGTGLRVDGTARAPPDWYRAELQRKGVKAVIAAERVRPDGRRRGGLAGFIDSLRDRAETALELAMSKREASLAKGFVLGQDETIDELTKSEFQASGLAHLLAVSGQNVVLLGLLALPLLALAGFGPRSRIVVLAGLILVYVPLTGAGASIQRAGVMGLAGLAAVLAARPGSRLYALGLAAVVTLGLNPRASADIGWQLSFAAVIGILVLAGPVQRRLEILIGSGGVRSPLNAGIAVTLAATIATAPLMIFHFETLPVTTVAANLAVLPAVAPAMWLGMVSAAVGQINATLAVPFNLINSVMLAYIAKIAEWFGGPAWATVDLRLAGPVQVAFAYVLLTAACGLLLRLSTPERLGRDRPPDDRRRARRVVITVALGLVVLAFAFGPGMFDPGRRTLGAPPEGGARVEVLDVGQGDAILIRPDGQDPVLIDGGPPGGDITGALESAGTDRLEAVILTHPDLDHAGGLYDVFTEHEVGRFLFDAVPPTLRRMVEGAGTRPVRVAAGQDLTLGAAEMKVLWPPPADPGQPPPEDPNTRSVVVELEVNGFTMLLTGDAEAEAAPVDPAQLDVLKVAHHGSDDDGLPALLARSGPELAVISDGEDNPYGHPTDDTLSALAEAGVPVARTDRDGTVSVVIGRSGWSLESGR